MIVGDVRQLCDGLDVGLRAADQETRLWDHCKLLGPTVSFGTNDDARAVALHAALADGWERVRFGRRMMVLCPGCLAEARRSARLTEELSGFRRLAPCDGGRRAS